MNGNPSRTAGLESADAGGADDHPQRPRSRTVHCIETALEILEGSNRQETAQARILLEEALLRIEGTETPG